MAHIQLLQGSGEIGPHETRQWIVFAIDFVATRAVVSSNAHPFSFGQSDFAERQIEVFEIIGQTTNADGSRRVFINVRSLSEETMSYFLQTAVVTA